MGKGVSRSIRDWLGVFVVFIASVAIRELGVAAGEHRILTFRPAGARRQFDYATISLLANAEKQATG